MTAPIPPTTQNIRAVAHNALMETLPAWMPLSDRVKVADAVAAAVEPLIRASERDRIRRLAQQRIEALDPEDWSEAGRTLADVLIITHEESS